MSRDDSVTSWIDGLKAGDSAAVEALWNRYFDQLVRLASKRLPAKLRRDLDEEDIALSAFQSLCEGVRHGQFPNIHDRNNLWALLVLIATRKISHRQRDAAAFKRGRGHVRGESVFVEREFGGLNNIIGKEPSPDFAMGVADELQLLINSLERPELKCVASLKLQGYTAAEIAHQMNCGRRTVERRLSLIRKCWLQHSEKD